MSNDRQNDATSSVPARKWRPLDGQDAGQHDARITKRLWQAQVRRAARWPACAARGPAAAITTFDPWFNPCPE